MRHLLLALALSGCAVAGGKSQPVQGDAPPVPGDAPVVRSDAPPPIDAPAQMMCTSTATCATAMALGSVSGDTGNASLQASGYQSAWYQVRVTEDDSGPLATPMQLNAQLTSPAGTNYDLYLYVNTGSDVVECTTASTSSTSTGPSDVAHLTWGETGTFANGADDSRTVSIEVRPVSGSCAPGATYQLTVTGDM